MKSEIMPEGEFRHPLFISPLTYHYRISFHRHGKSKTITYSSPHEIVLNLYAFQGDDSITYINRSDSKQLFRITIARFKSMLVECIHRVSQDELELLYLRLFLANRHKKTIIDKGRFLQHDLALKNYLLTIKGGHDSYLAYERENWVKLYFKYRRLSSLLLLALIQHWNLQHDIHFNHIAIPRPLANQGLLFEVIRLDFRYEEIKIVYYDPVEEDNIQATDIRTQIIQVFNQLIK